LAELGLSANAFGRAIGVPGNRISMILAGKRAVSAETALRLARFFGTTARFWLNLQQSYDLKMAERAFGRAVEREVRPRAAA
jgi:addiction module HigA family antidote